ncbi:phosphoglucosamine mutase [Halostagnicola larsenii XH-48]|uniref:Phosphoglucosamine mutase n=1 Tax=Halostagnicola larsenii XH-48 TaxID=797299 RepID=W0JM03_9EURY|nr:phosphoglucosamine mutase [Halostagnicola larsenii]AHF99755.1 phosphoglucosamine mutase [Halostagnicola larsenii XH-48]
MFGTSGLRGVVGDDVTADLALAVGRAVASEGYDRVVVGRDVRESGDVLLEAITAGLRECGTDVLEVGVAPTPTIARAVGWLEADAGVVVTASHNPKTDNGIKLWSADGSAFDPDQCAAVSDRVKKENYDIHGWDGYGSSERVEDVLDRHASALLESVSIEDPPSVVVDVGNGTGAITARVLTTAGCTVETLNGQQDGCFPGRPSEPTRETLSTLSALVEASDARIGIAHDGDADRMVAVDETGSFVPKDVLLALFARQAAEPADDALVAAPVDTSLAVDDALEPVGASVTRTRVGDVFVADRTTRDDVVFGGEPSGAWIWPDEVLCPDGPLAACKLVEFVTNRGTLSGLVDEIETYPIQRTSIEVAQKNAAMDRVRERVLDRYDDVDTLDGVYIDSGDGWILIRASGTEPLVRVTAEARTDARARQLFDEAVELVEESIASRGRLEETAC